MPHISMCGAQIYLPSLCRTRFGCPDRSGLCYNTPAMQITKDISVNATIDKAWPFVSDIPAVVSCFPGVTITEKVSDTEFRAMLRVRIGPFSPQFAGTATIEEKNDDVHKLVLRAKGADRKIGSNASALITVTLANPDSGSGFTSLHTLTDFQLTGPLGQFGKGIFEGIASRMMDEFAKNVNQRLA